MPDRLAKMIGDRVVIDLADGAFLGADAGGKIAEMIGREWYIGIHGLADRLAVVAGFDLCKEGEVLLDPVGDLVEHSRPLRRGGSAPSG